MADRGDTHYHVPALNLWFLGSSAFFLFTMIWTVIDDWDAEWKQYQQAFRALELEKAQAEQLQLEAEGATRAEDVLLAKVAAAQATLAEKGDELEEAEKEAYRLKEERFVKEEAFKRAKSVLGWDAWQIQKKLLAERKKKNQEFDEAEMEAELARVRAAVIDTDFEFETATTRWEAAEEKVATLKRELTEAEAALAVGTKQLTRVREKIDSLDPASFPKQAANVVRDFPGLDFVGPNLKVDKYVLDGITFNLNFTVKDRIDMCTTCHMGSDREGFEGDVQPHTTHPRLDLFLTSTSPHPVKDVGCTVCHRGSGESLGFQHADHRPSDAAEAKAWKKDHDWHKQKYWDYPMLRSKNIEASCVQCHKTSMEIIGPDAPTLFKGYELFETKGCYACHKVDWFPTQRKPGPALTNLAAKLQPEFVNSWIAAPRAFRPKTHMPQVFHLENFDPEEEVVAASNYGDGDPILGQAWNDTAVAAITAFLYDNHPKQDLPPIPAGLEGDAERGREVMNVSGCFACHNTAPYDAGDTGPPLLSNNVTGHGRGVGKNQMGPDLRGVATKVDQTWLFHWILDPTSYWPGTRMPTLGLSEQDALDIATYMTEDPDGVFMDTPDGWSVDTDWRDKLDRTVLEEQARWYYQKDGRQALMDRLAGEWADDETLAVNVGRALVTNQGCFSCHLIDGMETMMPIGTELSTWSTKTVDKLDFGQHYHQDMQIPEAFAEANGIPEAERKLPKLDKYYREGWIERKLAHPRIFDIDMVKTPKDKLRMPWFDLTEDEIHAISTFVLGLVEDEVGPNAMFPTHEQASTEMGLRAVRQNNCLSCHQVEPSRVTYEDADGNHVTVEGEVMQLFTDDPLPPRMDSMEAFLEDVAASEDWMEEEVEEYSVRLLAVDPDHGFPDEKIFVEKDKLVAVHPAVGGDFVRHMTEYYMRGTKYLPNEDFDPDDPDSGPSHFGATLGWDEDNQVNLIEDVDGVQRPYPNEQYDKVRWTFAPPVLWNEGHKLQTDWFYSFLEDPLPLRNQIRVQMPKFEFDPGEAEAIADYFASKARWEWHARYAKTLRSALGRTIDADLEDGSKPHEWDLSRQAMEWPTVAHVTGQSVLSLEDMAAMMADPTIKLEADVLAAIEAGSKPETLANFAKLKAFGDAQGFSMSGPIKVGHELVERRTQSYLADHGGLWSAGQALALDGVNCYQCHPHPDKGYTGLDPIAWAPPLEYVRERLREDWVREWQWSPLRKYPGTAMPENFSSPMPQYEDQYPGATNEQQIEAILVWLYNLDRPQTK